MKRAKKKDTDPHGITASMKLVKEVSELEWTPISWVADDPYRELVRKARRIRRKFKKKPGNIKRLAQNLNKALQEHYDDN